MSNPNSPTSRNSSRPVSAITKEVLLQQVINYLNLNLCYHSMLFIWIIIRLILQIEDVKADIDYYKLEAVVLSKYYDKKRAEMISFDE
jgi:hypothetical protein